MTKTYFTCYCLLTTITGILSATSPLTMLPMAILLLGCLLKTKQTSLLYALLVLYISTTALTYHNQKSYTHHQPAIQKKHTFQATLLEDPYPKKKTITALANYYGHKVQLKWKTPPNDIQYASVITVSGKWQTLSQPTNPGQMNYPKYLKTKDILGVFNVQNTKKIEQTWGNPFKRLALSIKKRIRESHQASLESPYSDLLIGLIFGDHGTNLPDSFKNLYHRAGLTHLLVVSGSQVALLNSIVQSMARTFYWNRHLTYLLSTLINILFYFVTGGGASILRASSMCQLTLSFQYYQHRTTLLHQLSGIAWIMLLFNPNILYDLGAHLSFLATIALLIGVPKVVEWLPERWPQALKEILSLSIAPFLFTAPLLWSCFQEITWVAILSNIFIVPWIEGLVTIGFGAALIGFISPTLMGLLHQSCWLIMKAMNLSATIITQIPYSTVYIKPLTQGYVAIAYALIFITFQSKPARKPVLWLLLFITGSLIGYILIPNRDMTVTYLDVGQGDATLIETPKGKTILIDGGNQKLNYRTQEVLIDQGERTLFPVLKHKGINKIDLIIVTHFDRDHFGGIPYILNTFPVGMVIDNGQSLSKNKAYLDIIQKKNIHRLKAIAGQSITFDKHLTLDILSPFTTPPYHKKENNNSISVKLSYGDIDFLFTGDSEKELERHLSEYYGSNLDVEVLKVGHHGSNTSSIPVFLNQVTPEHSIISSGRKNRYGHPTKKVLHRLNRYGDVHRTDKNGAITIQTDGKTLNVSHYL